jgi:hypothetical protein
MRNIFLILFFFSSFHSFSQSVNPLEFKIPLKIILPENLDYLNPRQLSALNSKITNLVTQTGLSGGEYANSSFVIFPKILIGSMEMAETGMTNVYKTSVEVSLYVKDVENDIIYASTTVTLNGSGLSKDLAIGSAIQSFPLQNNNLDLFFKTSKSKILNYYNLNCSKILDKAQSYASQQDYELAIATIYNIPEQVDCYTGALKKIDAFYRAHQNKVCNTKLQRAKTLAGARDFRAALDELSSLDPLTNCKAESEKIIAKCFSNITQEQIQAYKMSMMIYQNESDLEKRRIDAVKDIAVAYFKSQPTTVIYNNKYEYNRLIVF